MKKIIKSLCCFLFLVSVQPLWAMSVRAENLNVRLRTQQPRPLILWMHGCTQSASEFLSLTKLQEKQESLGIDSIVLAPDQSFFKNPLSCWNWFTGSNQTRGAGKLQEIVDQIQRLIAKGFVDPEQVYVGGFSAGGVMATHFAYCYPDVFKTVLIHSGAPFKFLTRQKYSENDLGQKAIDCSRTVKHKRLKDILIVHGTRDKIAFPSNGVKSVDQALYFMDKIDDGQKNYSLRKTLDAGGLARWESNQGHSVNYISITNMGHAWSGGDPRYRFTSPHTIDATQLFLELLKK